MNTSQKPINVDMYIDQAPEHVRGVLKKLRSVIRKAAPKAIEKISYGMPFYEYGGAGFKGRLIYFSATSKYISIYIPPSRIKKTLNELKKYQSTKSAYHFPLDDSFPFVLIDKTVREMVGNINAGE